MTAVCSAVALIPAISVQANASDSDPITTLYVGSEQIVNGSTINESEVAFGSGTVKYDDSTNTLTLTNADITTFSSIANSQAGIQANGNLKIHLVGSNTITVPDCTTAGAFNYGIYVAKNDNDECSLTFTAAAGASLTINAGKVTGSGESTGIYTVGGTLTVESGTITANGGTTDAHSYGVKTTSLNVSGGTLNANGGEGGSVGIDANDIKVTGGELNATAAGTSETGLSKGIDVYESLTVEGGKVTANGGAGGNSYGIFSSNSSKNNTITVSGGELNATAADTTGDSVNNMGIYTTGTITASGNGKIVGNGGDSVGPNYGINSEKSITVSGTASVTGNGGTSTSKISYGIHARPSSSTDTGTITVSDSASVTGVGGEAGTYSYGLYAHLYNITGGTTKGTAGEAGFFSCGVYTYTSNSGYTGGGINISAGTLIGEGGKSNGTSTSNYGSYGIFTDTASPLNAGGTAVVKGTGAEAVYISMGICVDNNITVGDTASVTGNGGDANGFSYGVQATSTLTVSGGTLNANGGESDGPSYGVQTTSALTVSGGALTANGGDAGTLSYGVSTFERQRRYAYLQQRHINK